MAFVDFGAFLMQLSVIQMLAVCLTLNAHQCSVYSSSFRVIVMLKNEVQHLRNQDILLLKTTFKNIKKVWLLEAKI